MLENEIVSYLPSKIIISGDIFLEKVSTKMNLTESQLCLSKTFSGGLNGRLKLATDLNFTNLKKSQIGFVEGLMCEAFNLLSQNILLSICDSSDKVLIPMPTKVWRSLSEAIDCHQLYRLNLSTGFCHCVLEFKLGGEH